MLACDLTSHLEPHNMQANDGCVLGKSFRHRARSEQSQMLRLRCFSLFFAPELFALLCCWCHTWLNCWPDYPQAAVNLKRCSLRGKKKCKTVCFFLFIYHSNNVISDYWLLKKMKTSLLDAVWENRVMWGEHNAPSRLSSWPTSSLVKVQHFLCCST